MYTQYSMLSLRLVKSHKINIFFSHIKRKMLILITKSNQIVFLIKFNHLEQWALLVLIIINYYYFIIVGLFFFVTL